MKQLAWIAVAVAVAVAACQGASPSGAGPTDDLYLTVMDVGGHCSVTIDDQEPSTSAQQTIADYQPGQTIALAASATPGFTLGLWHHTSGDAGAGDPGTIADGESATSVTLGDSPGCVWICCASATSACPTADPCR